ncbi:hypothetical protein AA0313_1804 [Acetobacter indonesiensis NRIC 0313]|uniref:Uncharacterized protein n=1 Tax=Acetobacter indonesiensis TaxID=104101 RepID=A0A6N3T5Y5_9PROT|nr:hypothetical protein [Acetobacter indonesiensis]GAN64383.1 hypothetical protein Abin_064_003 [Acetobacter indonesiensis]GBQ58470.1 hypothetical protein AA0313_1804 [Acetobacter indonesiensis NRIC 0313]GEN04273.1 hypothetical protein AIN02nite_22980 [Acetobacter indonesiensis]
MIGFFRFTPSIRILPALSEGSARNRFGLLLQDTEKAHWLVSLTGSNTASRTINHDIVTTTTKSHFLL